MKGKFASCLGGPVRFWKRQRGSAATEYMLVVSVITIGVTAAGYAYVPGFREGTAALSQDVSSILATGDVGDIGFARHGDKTIDTGTSPGAPSTSGGSGNGGGDGCTGGFIQRCSAQTAGVGGIQNPTSGSGSDVSVGASRSAVATLQDPNANFVDRVVARQEVLQNVTQDCSQVFLAGVTGQRTSTVTVATVTEGLTVPDTMKINLPFLGISLGGIPTDYKGYMSLAQMQSYLTRQGIGATVSQNTTTTQIAQALASGQKVGVIIDVDANGNPVAGCGGKCGHTVKVTNVSPDFVTIKDRNGSRDVPIHDFENALSAQGGGMIVVTPKGHGGGWASNR